MILREGIETLENTSENILKTRQIIFLSQTHFFPEIPDDVLRANTQSILTYMERFLQTKEPSFVHITLWTILHLLNSTYSSRLFLLSPANISKNLRFFSQRKNVPMVFSFSRFS